MPVTNAVCAERLGNTLCFFPNLATLSFNNVCIDEIVQGASTASDVNDLDPLLR